MIGLTVGRSAGASRTSAIRTEMMAAPLPNGAELTALSASLEEWDEIAATLPPSVRPPRGVWSPAIETAAIKLRQAKARAALKRPRVFIPVPPPTRIELIAQRNGSQGGRPKSGTAQRIRDFLRSQPLTMGDIAKHLFDQPRMSLEGTVYRLMREGEIVPVGPRHRHVGKGSKHRQYYGLAGIDYSGFFDGGES